MKSSIQQFLILSGLFFFMSMLPAQSCYERLFDASGLDTAPYQQALEDSACALKAVFPVEFQGLFKVYDVGFYLHNTVTSGYPQVFETAKDTVASKSPYYLLFGKQTDQNGIYTRFWVDLKLPTTGKFGCIDLVSPTLRADIKRKIEYVTSETYKNDGKAYYLYFHAEMEAMAALKKIVTDYVNCCNLLSRNTGDSSSCQAFLFPASLTEVTYSGLNYIEMKQDVGGNFGQAFPKPHFDIIRPNDSQSPVACVSGFNISALTIFNGNAFFEKMKVRGIGTSQVSGVTITINFTEQTATQDPISLQIIANMTGQFPHMAVFLDDFKIKWEMTVKKPGESWGGWEPVGESLNDWYLTLRKPKPEGTGVGYAHYLTLFDIGCRYGMGKTDLQLIKGVWGHFASLQVKKSDGQPLAYYKNWIFPPNLTSVYTSDLLQHEEGQCNAWAKFFLDVLKAQGYLEDGFLVTIKPDPTNQIRPFGGFMLGTWNFRTGVSIGEENFDFWNIYDNDNKYSKDSYGKWEHIWWQNSSIPLPQVTQIGYVAAQGNPKNSLSYFGQHVIIKIKSEGIERYLDPSYGIEYDSTLDKMDNNIAGFWLEINDYTFPISITPTPTNGYNDLVLFRKNKIIDKLKITDQNKY